MIGLYTNFHDFNSLIDNNGSFFPTSPYYVVIIISIISKGKFFREDGSSGESHMSGVCGGGRRGVLEREKGFCHKSSPGLKSFT